MRKILAIAFTDLRSEFQSPASWFVIFLMPILLTGLLANIGGGGVANSRTELLVINEDGGALAETVLAALATSDAVVLATPPDGESLPATREEALAQLESYGRVLILPQGFTVSLQNGTPIEVPFYADPGTTAERTQAVQQALNNIFLQVGSQQAVVRLAAATAADLRPFADDAERTTFEGQTLTELQNRQATGGVTVQSTPASALQGAITGGAAQSSPGQMVVFALIMLLGISEVFLSERQWGTLRRLLTCAVPRWQIIAGKSAGRLLIGLLQMTVLILVGQWVFGVSWGRSPLALAAVVLSFSLAALGLGMMLATIVRSHEQANQLAIAASLFMGALGGAWWSLELVQGPMRTVAMLIPTGWAMMGFQSIILRGATFMDVLPNVAVLLGFAVVFFGIGASRLEFE